MGQLDEDGVTNGGLKCVAVLIGAFQKSTGLPIIGVAVQPFWELDPASQQSVVAVVVVVVVFCLMFSSFRWVLIILKRPCVFV